MSPRDEERRFLEQYDPAAFDRPSVSVDVVVLTVRNGQLCALLVQRSSHPFQGRWMLPGGFVGMGEGIDEAAQRLLQAKGGLGGVFLEQLYTFGAPDRDPRMRVITVAHLALVPAASLVGVRGQLAQLVVPWPDEEGGPVAAQGPDGPLPLAFDHADVLGMAVKRVRGRLTYSPIAYALLPETFTLRDLQGVHEAVLGHPVNKASFRRRLLASGELVATGQREQDTPHRPAELFRCALD